MRKMPWQELHYLISVKIPLEEFEQYINFIEFSFNQELSSLDKRIAEIADPDSRDEFVDWHYDEIVKYRDDFPNLLRSSLLITIYSFLEKNLLTLCGPGVHFRNNILEEAKDYLINLGIDFPVTSESWIFIKKVKLIRNCIVHYGGDISSIVRDKQRRDTEEVIEELNNIMVDHLGVIQIEEGFCNEFIIHTGNLLKVLHEKKYEISIL